MSVIGIAPTRLLPSAFALFVSASTVFAADCRFLGADLHQTSQLSEFRELWVKNGKWEPVLTPSLDLKRRSLHFAYVIREEASTPRRGVLLIKTGRDIKIVTGSSFRKRVALERRAEIEAANDGEKLITSSCKHKGPFAGSVQANNYDAYHDHGTKVAEPDRTSLKDFHFEYPKSVGCRATDDNSVDSLVPLDFRSNRSQFSFDRAVVREGTYSQLLTLLFTPFTPESAFADSDKFADQRVETLEYQTKPGKTVCVRFDVSVDGPGAFLRLNDLEARYLVNLDWLRTPEQEWSLSPPVR